MWCSQTRQKVKFLIKNTLCHIWRLTLHLTLPSVKFEGGRIIARGCFSPQSKKLDKNYTYLNFFIITYYPCYCPLCFISCCFCMFAPRGWPNFHLPWRKKTVQKEEPLIWPWMVVFKLEVLADVDETSWPSSCSRGALLGFMSHVCPYRHVFTADCCGKSSRLLLQRFNCLCLGYQPSLGTPVFKRSGGCPQKLSREKLHGPWRRNYECGWNYRINQKLQSNIKRHR